MSVFKCKMCGGNIEFNPGDSIGVCDSCGTKQTLPKLDDDRRTNLYDRANHFRRNNEFDKAMSIYEKILEEDNTDAETYWSIVLCRYGIEYVEDPATHKRVPTVNRAQYSSVVSDKDYKSALKYGTPEQKELYKAEARAIDKIQKGILEISQKEEPFDVFICYKETDNQGRRTPDSVLANDLYHQLVQEGFKVFFSRITLEDKLGTAYEPYIFAALNSAKVMVVLGTKPEYFNAVWVKNEWNRYLALVNASSGKKMLIPAYKDMDPYDLPEEFSHLQAQDMSKLGFMQDLIRGIKKIVSADTPATVVKETLSAAPVAAVNAAPLLERAFMFLEDGNWDDADAYCEKVLDQDPKNAQAYLGKLMAELQVNKQEDLKNCGKPFDTSTNYQKAVRFGNDSFAEQLKADNEENLKYIIYQDAVKTMETASDESSLKKAALKFNSISGYLDSDEQINLCNKRIEEIKAKVEADRLEAERKAEENRKQEEKTKHLVKKVVKITLPIVTIIIIISIILNTVIIPSNNYKKALSLCENNDYSKAYDILLQNPNKGTQKQIKKIKEKEASFLMDAGQFENAYSILEEIGETDAIISSKHERAVSLIQSGEYEKAYNLLEEIGEKEVLESNKYERAVNLIDSGDYETAYTLLEEINYKDSSQKLADIKPQYHKILLQKAQVGSKVYFGSYEQDNDISNGKEDISWRVLAKENGKILVISDFILDSKQYNTTDESVTWQTCSLRKWLNETFLNDAFSKDEQKMIPTVTVTADIDKNANKKPGANTKDKVFLLSSKEAKEYFGFAEIDKNAEFKISSKEATKYSDSNARSSPTSYASTKDNAGYWWLRTPDDESNSFYVFPMGNIYSGGYIFYSMGIRPVIWINN